MYKLVIQDDEGKTTVVPLIRDELTIGRKEGNTVRLTERNVSRRHARLLRQNGSISIEDLNSYNGIRVNGTRIQGRAAIKETDRVQIGDYLIEIKSEAAAAQKNESGSRPAVLERVADAAPEPVAPVDSAAQATNRITISAETPTAALYPLTEPMIALADVDGSPRPAAAPNGRLVVLSTLFAGLEFDLDKAAVVIGRTEDNDVCLNHRSISRHHAKVVRENGRYQIVDLQSSNGVRVNGEEYGKVELRRGDLIDLGHIRLRFVEPGEDFLFGRDAVAVDIEAAATSRTMLWAVLALLLVGAVAVVVLVSNGDGEPPQATPTPVETPRQPAPTPGIVTPVPPDVPTPVVVPAMSDAGTAAVAVSPPAVTDAGAAVAPVAPDNGQHLQLARLAMGEERWQAAADEARAALAANPQDAAAKAVADQARSELGQQKLFVEFGKAVATKQLARVADLFKKISATSIYKEKAQPDYDRLKADYLRAQADAGRKEAERGKCAAQRRRALDAERMWGAGARAAVLATACKDAASPGPASPNPAAAPEESDGASADALLADARRAALSDQFGTALRLCQAALVKRPGDAEAAQICVIAACNIKSAVTAKKFIDKVKSANRVQSLRQICLSKGVDIN